jgi:cobalamin biosynthesis Mg chelatase CobN
MKRDTVKTLAGLLIIGIIVVATFLYGNAQRQSQLRRDEDAKKQQQAKANDQAKKVQPSAAAAPSTSAAASSSNKTAAHNTAPVQSPAANGIQGNGGAAPKPGQVASAATTTPATGAGAGAALPETGSPVVGVVGVAAMAAMAIALWRSKRAVFAAARVRR